VLPPDVRSLAQRWIEEKKSDIRRRISVLGAEEFASDVETVFRALAHLHEDSDPILLAVLATLAANDAHVLDAGTRLGALLDRVLEFRHPEISPYRRYSYRIHLHAAAGIVRNRISARVDTYGLVGDSHYVRALMARDLDRTLTLRSLEHLRGDRLRGRGDTAFVVENASVFEHLVNAAATISADVRPTIICTNGWLNAAARVLLRTVVVNGTQLLYSGDFDEAGIAIALEIQRLYSATLWRMTADDFHAGAGQRQLRARAGRVQRFRQVLPTLTSAIERTGYAVHQEAILDRLQRDVVEFAEHLRGTHPLHPVERWQ
jgi:uncharacterized protein (TIGR02679 family)